jgi:hypothetical protein
MNFDDVVDLVINAHPEAYTETEGYGIDMYDAIQDLGKTISHDYGYDLYEKDHRNAIQSHIELSERFLSFQHAQSTAINVVHSCYYTVFGAHLTMHDEKSLTVRYVTAGNALVVTGSVTISGPHYEKLYAEYLEFKRRNRM